MDGWVDRSEQDQSRDSLLSMARTMALEEVQKGRMYPLDTCEKLYYILDGECKVPPVAKTWQTMAIWYIAGQLVGGVSLLPTPCDLGGASCSSRRNAAEPLPNPSRTPPEPPLVSLTARDARPQGDG